MHESGHLLVSAAFQPRPAFTKNSPSCAASCQRRRLARRGWHAAAGNDAWIATHARPFATRRVTDKSREFERVSGTRRPTGQSRCVPQIHRRHRYPPLQRRIDRHAPRQLAMSVVVYEELQFGIAKSAHREDVQLRLDAFAQIVPALALPRRQQNTTGIFEPGLPTVARRLAGTIDGLQRTRARSIPAW